MVSFFGIKNAFLAFSSKTTRQIYANFFQGLGKTLVHFNLH